MRKTNILWFLVGFIVLVIGYNLVFNKNRKEGYHGGGEHHGGGGNHVYHSYSGHGGYYGDGYGYGRDYGRDYGYYAVANEMRNRDLMTFYLLYPFLIFGVLALFLSNRE